MNSVELNMNETITKQIIKSADSIKNKIKQLKDDEFNTNIHLNQFFKPIATPLNAMVSSNKQCDITSNENSYDNQHYAISGSSKILLPNKYDTEKEDKRFDFKSKSESNNESDASEIYYSEDEEISLDKANDMSLRKDDMLEIYNDMNIPFGVRSENNKMMIGNTVVNISKSYDNLTNHKIYNLNIDDKKYLLTPGLKELLLHKKPNLSLVSDSDRLIYKGILIKTNAHRKYYNPDGQVKGDKGIKYRQIIKPLLQEINTNPFQGLKEISSSHKRGSGLPKMKTYVKDTELIYWDDPNELIERLKLLYASKNAGNTGLDNEIISIIEELKEAGIIKGYKDL